jgi:hypothetical protein
MFLRFRHYKSKQSERRAHCSLQDSLAVSEKEAVVAEDFVLPVFEFGYLGRYLLLAVLQTGSWILARGVIEACFAGNR